MTSVVLPTVLASLGLAPMEEVQPEAERGEALLPIEVAVQEAARHPGASVEPAAGREPTPAGRGRFVQLRRRRRQPESEVETPQETEQQPADSTG
jgi:hypothetical protein